MAQVMALVEALPDRAPRRLVAVAGPPASGKSTLAEALAAAHSEAVAVPMDGFHLDNAVLDARGLRARKGAPETFDAAGFVAAMARLRRDAEVILPAFDRARDIAIAGRIVVEPAQRVAFVEGNYLCLNEAPWTELRPLWDLTVFLDVPEDILRQRLVQRWLDHGMDAAAALARAEANDLPNALRVARESLAADVRLSTDG